MERARPAGDCAAVAVVPLGQHQSRAAPPGAGLAARRKRRVRCSPEAWQPGRTWRPELPQRRPLCPLPQHQDVVSLVASTAAVHTGMLLCVLALPLCSRVTWGRLPSPWAHFLGRKQTSSQAPLHWRACGPTADGGCTDWYRKGLWRQDPGSLTELEALGPGTGATRILSAEAVDRLVRI